MTRDGAPNRMGSRSVLDGFVLKIITPAPPILYDPNDVLVGHSGKKEGCVKRYH